MASKKVTVGLLVLLLASVAGNLFFMGLVTGRAMSPEKKVERFLEHDRQLRAQIPDQDKQVLRRLMKDHLPQMKQARKELEQARRQVHQAIAAEPLDEDALRAALENMLSQQTRMHGVMTDLVMSAAHDLSPEGRKAMVQHILFRDQAEQHRKQRVQKFMMDRRQKLMKQRHDLPVTQSERPDSMPPDPMPMDLPPAPPMPDVD